MVWAPGAPLFPTWGSLRPPLLSAVGSCYLKKQVSSKKVTDPWLRAGAREGGPADRPDLPGLPRLELAQLPGRTWSWRAGGGRGSRTPMSRAVAGGGRWPVLEPRAAGRGGERRLSNEHSVGRCHGVTRTLPGGPASGRCDGRTGRSSPAGRSRPPAPARARRPAERWVPAHPQPSVGVLPTPSSSLCP